MSKRLGLLIVMMLFVSLMTGCFGSDDSSTPTPAATSSVVITGTIPALSAPAGVPNFAAVPYGTNYEMLVVNGATMAEITGSAVVINGTTYTATVPAGAANVTALVVIRSKATGKVLYSALVGNIPTATQMSSASVTKVTVSGINLNSESTALATIAKDKNIVAPTVPVSSSVTTMSATVKSNIENAVGAATVTAIKDATAAINAVLNNSGVSQTVKDSILSTLGTTLSSVLNAFVTAVKDATAVVSQEIGATTITVGSSVISSTTTPTQVETAVGQVTVVTVASINALQDIVVGNGTAVTAIPFPTTVTVVMSNSTTATKNVVWSTTSTPAYNATTSATYTFTGVVDGTTLTASVKVIVGGLQLRVSNPAFSPVGGVTYTSAQNVTITCATEGATIHYTVNGDEPTTSSPVYSAAINVATTTTIKALAVKTGFTSSEVVTAVYTINIPATLAISNGRAIKKADGTIAITWNTNIAPTKGAKVSLINTAVPPTAGVVNYVNETSFDGTNHSVILPATVINVVANYNRVTVAYILSEEEIIASNIDTFEDETLTPILSTVVAVNGTLTLTFTGVAVPTNVAVTDFAVKNSINGSTYADVTPSAITRVSDTVVELAVASINATDVDQIVLYSAAYKTGTVVLSGSFTVAKTSTTKVLTGITLAKETDTVEANVAYTMPAVTAAYDDNSTGTVTATWIEVLAGGTVEVTSPVTKTAAGTYNFMASYTEGAVTQVDYFTLVVTEPVPVKTLDSLTVTATPAAPTCLVGGTATVALKVVANYLTGTVATTEEVTTFTTGTNWAAGVFTAATTVAGTENIVVSFGGKTANVPVTVTLEAPVASTIEVTFASTMAETTSTAAVVVVKDQFGAVMTTGFATTYAITTGNSTVSAAGLVTAGAYDASTAANNNHVLTVTVTPTGKTAITKTAAFTVTGDTTKPTITSVTAVNNKTFVVTFSKKVDDNSVTMDAIDGTLPTYQLYGASQTVTLSTGASSDGVAQVTAAFVDSTKTSIKFVVVSVNAAQKTGLFPMGLMTDIAYKFYASDVKDTAATPNTIIKLSNVSFTGSTLPDSAAPAIATASYDTGLAKLSLTFDKAIDAASNNGAKYSIVNGATTVILTGVTGTASGNSLTFSLTDAQKTSLGTLATGATVSIAIGGVTDGTNANAAVLTKELTATVRPSLLNATYDETTNKITLGFSEPVKLATIDRAKLHFNYLVSSTSTDLVVASANMVIATTGTTAQTVEITLNQTGINTMNAQRANTNVTSYTVKMDDNAVEDADSNKCQTVATYQTVTMTYTKDTAIPTITGVTYTTSDDKLVVTYSKVMNTTVDAKANMVLKTKNAAGDALAVIDANVEGLANTGTWATDGKSITFVLDATEAPAFETAVAYGRFLTVSSGHGLKDVNSNALVDITSAAAAKVVTYTDNTTAGLVVGSSVNAKVVNVTLKKDASTTMLPHADCAKGTFKVIDANNAAVTYTPAWAQMLDLNNDGIKEQLTLGFTTALPSGSQYKVQYTGLKTEGGVAVADGTTAAFDLTTDVTAPLLTVTNPAVFEDVDASKSVTAGDRVTLTFGEAINVPTTGNTLADDMFGTSASRGTFAEGSAKNIVVVTLGTLPTLKLDAVGSAGTTLVNPSNVIVDFNAVAWTGVAQSIEVPYPTGAAAPVQTGNIYFTDVDNDAKLSIGDKLTIPFDVKLDSTLDILEAQIAVVIAGTAKQGTTTFTAAQNSNEVVLTFTAVDALDAEPLVSELAAGSTVTITGSTSNIKSSWGLETANLSTKSVVAPTGTVGPKPTAIYYAAATNRLKVVFDKPVFLTAPGVVDIDNTKLFTTTTGTLTKLKAMVVDTDLWLDSTDTTKKTVILCCETGTTGIEPGTTLMNVRVGGAIVTFIRDFYGNKAIRNAAGDLTVQADPATVEIPSATYTIVTAADPANNNEIRYNSTTDKIIVRDSNVNTEYVTGSSNFTLVKNILSIASNGLLAADTITVARDGVTAVVINNTGTAARTVALGTTIKNTATLTVNGNTTAATTVSGTTSGNVTLNAAGLYSVTDSNLTGTIGYNVAGAATLTTGANKVAVGATAAANVVGITATGGTIDVNGGATATTITSANAVTINGIKITPSASTAMLAAANKVSMAGSATTYTIEATDGTAAKTVDFTSAQTGKVIAKASELTNGLILTAGAASSAAIDVTGGLVNLENTNLDGTLSVVAAANTTVKAAGQTLSAVSGAYTIELTSSGAAITAATVSGAVTTLTASKAVTTLTVNALVTTLNVGAASTKVVAGTSASTTNVVITADVTGTAIETAVSTITVNATAVATTGNTVTLKNTSASAMSGLVVTLDALNASSAVTNVALTATLTDNLTGWATQLWDIGASVATGTYSTLTTSKAITLNALAAAETVTLTNL